LVKEEKTRLGRNSHLGEGLGTVGGGGEERGVSNKEK